MDEWQQRQRELEEAQRRGELVADVRTLARNFEELRVSLRDIETVLTQISKEMLTRKEYDLLKTQVDELSKWRWLMAGGMGLLIFLSQALPRVIDLVKQP
ncbi:MAG: hypothetical protein ACREM3_18510 [Candidatus Rokuibacteriota bacterium]